jgi:hypothetical protein
MKTITKIIYLASAAFMLTCFALSPRAQATDLGGVLPNENTADGAVVLTVLSTGSRNSGFGFRALEHNSIGSNNTATGHTALNQNQAGTFNTADGATALFQNFNGYRNTATGYAALQQNFGGSNNTASGYQALWNNDASDNTATGYQALQGNTTGDFNTATGVEALLRSAVGAFNTATGAAALANNRSGNFNTADGTGALVFNTSGNNNIALGQFAGSNLTTGDNNIDIGNEGVAAEPNTIRIGTQGTQMATYIAGIFSEAVGANNLPVLIDTNGKLGTTTMSSRRFKNEIKAMDQASEAILALKPVTFHYNDDKTNTPQFGLIAEQVAEVNRDLVVRDKHGQIYAVRYDAVNAMLLNEFLKEHRKVEEQQATIAQLKKEMETVVVHLKEQDSKIQKVSGQLERSKPMSKVVLNNP